MNRLFKLIFAVLLAAYGPVPARAQLYVLYSNAGLVSEYDAESGALIDETLVMGLHDPHGICVADGFLYVAQRGNGTIGKYDAHTGRAINEALVTNLNMPQAIAVEGNVLYVSDFARPGPARVGKYNAVNGATMSPDLIPQVAVPTSMVAAVGKLFMTFGHAINTLAVYDGATGALIKDRLRRFGGGEGLAGSDHEMFVSMDLNAPNGCVFKIDPETEMNATGPTIFRPLVTGLDFPQAIAVSGDYLYVASGTAATVGQYNRVTGAVINPKLVPPLGDRLGGIAVVPKAASSKYAMESAEFEFETVVSNFRLIMLANGNYLFLGIGVFGTLVGVALFRLLFRPPIPLPVEVAAESPSPEPAGEQKPPAVETTPEQPEQPATSIHSLPAKPVPYTLSQLLMMGLSITAVAFVIISIAGYYAYQFALSTNLVHVQDADADRIGDWLDDNSFIRLDNEAPIYNELWIYRTRIEYNDGHGIKSKAGLWKDDHFSCLAPDGSGYVSVARIVGPDQIELHRSAFDPSSSQVEILYKQHGSDAEMQAMAAKYPLPIAYPPPAGVIRAGMTQYELENLPWQPETRIVSEEKKYDRSFVYVYRSDVRGVESLKVTVKNHRVIFVQGGNG